MLTVSAAIRSTPAGFPASATYNGVAMTKAANQTTNNSTDGYVVLFYLLAPATGANNVVVSWTGGAATASHPCLGHSVSYTGVGSVTNVTTPTFGASGLNTITVTSATGNMPHATMASAISYSATNQTLRNRTNFSTANAAGNLQSVDAAGAASVTLNGTANDWWAVVGIDLVASGGGAAYPYELLTQTPRAY